MLVFFFLMGNELFTSLCPLNIRFAKLQKNIYISHIYYQVFFVTLSIRVV